MANIIEKLILNGTEYEIPSGSGGGVDVETAAAISDAKMGNYDTVFMLKSWLYQVLNWLSSEDAIGLTAGEDREAITNDTDSMSIISHGWTVMSWISNSKYAMELICSKNGATKEVSECWNSIYIIAYNELARGIYLNSEYWKYYLSNYQVVQDAFGAVLNTLRGKQLIPFLTIDTYYNQIMSTPDLKDSLSVCTLDDLTPTVCYYAELTGYNTWDDIVADSTALNTVLNNSTCMEILSCSSEFMPRIIENIPLFVNNQAIMEMVANSAELIGLCVNDATTMNAIAGSSTAMSVMVSSSTAMNAIAGSSVAMSAMASSAMALNKITKSSTAIAAITSSANNSKLQDVRTTIYNTVTGNSTYFTQKYRGYQDGVSSLNSKCTTANCIVMACLGTYSSSSSYSILTHSNNVQAAKYNTPTRPTSVTASNCNGISFTNCKFTESGDWYAAAAVYTAI